MNQQYVVKVHHILLNVNEALNYPNIETIKMGKTRPLHCWYLFLSNKFFTEKNFTGIQTQIIGVEGKHVPEHLIIK